MMKKRIPIYHYICVGLVLGSLFLPWTKFDLYSGGLFSNMNLVKTGVMKAGISYPGTYYLLGGMIMISAIMLSIRSIATAIVGLIFSLGLLIYMPLLGFGLTFTLFGQERNSDLQLGYYISLLSVIVYFGFSIYSLVYEARSNKNTAAAQKVKNEDLLDDF